MLDAMRRGAKSWVAKGLMLLLIASFAVWGIGDVFSTRGDSTVASVGDETVTVDEYANALQRQRTQMSQRSGRAVSYADMRRMGVDQRILDQLVRDAAFRAELARLGLSAPDDAVAEAIRTNDAFRTSEGGFSQSRYRLTLSRLGFTPAEFEGLTRTVLGQQILQDAIRPVTEPLPGVAPRIAQHGAERRGVAYVTLPLSMAVEAGEPSQEDLRAYYAENRATWREPERRWGRVLHVDVAALSAENPPSEEEVRAAYEARAGDYDTPATRTLDQLPLTRGKASVQAERVRSGETTFEALARDLGEDPADLSLGTVERDDLPGAVADAAFARKAPGIVGPVQAPAGPVLIRVRSVTEGGSVPFAEVRDEIAAELARDAAHVRAAELAGRIEDLRAEGLSLEQIASETGLALKPFEGLARNGTLADGTEAGGVISRGPVIEEIFTALDHEEREILETQAGGYFLVMVERIEESRVPDLAEIRERVVADWKRAQRRETLLARAREHADRLSGEDSLTQLAGDLGQSVEVVEPFRRGQPPSALPRLLVSRLFALEAGGAAAAPAAGGDGVVLAEVTEVVMPDPETLEAMSERIAADFSSRLDQDTREFYARAVRNRFEVTVNRGAVEDVFALIGANSGTGG